MPKAAVEARRVSMYFGGVAALDNVSFKLDDRELRCLIGPNGAGKSTFFKCLTGQLRPTEGQVFIGNEETTGLRPSRIARLGIGIKTQVPNLMNGLSARENVWLAARRCVQGREAERRTQEVLERLSIADLAGEEAGRLAHGQRQLVELGTVLAGRPWLVLLDEPVAGLTGDEVARMVEVIRDINREAAMIIVEHDMHFIRTIARTVTVFHQGRILTEAPVEEVLADERVRNVYLGKRR